MSERAITSHTVVISDAQAARLREILVEEGYAFHEKPHTRFSASKPGVTVAVYERGPKVLVQGKGTRDFVEFVLEPRVLGAAGLGYEEILDPEQFESHIGVDESGKGDFFGPLVIAAVHVNGASARALKNAGVQDSKRITSDARIKDRAEAIRKIVGGEYSVIVIGPAKYNDLYVKMGNLNALLGWGHARAIENVLEKVPECPRALSDKFADPRVIERALLERGRGIRLDQRTKGESDIAVAAASIIAREGFVQWHRDAERRHKIKFPRGASAQVKEAARELVAKEGAEILRQVAKVHFRTAWEVAPREFPEPPPRKEWRA